MRPSILLTALLLAGLTGCTTIYPVQRRAADEASCRDYGFRRGTDAFAECLQRIDLSRRADRRAVFNNDPFLRGPYYGPVILR